MSRTHHARVCSIICIGLLKEGRMIKNIIWLKWSKLLLHGSYFLGCSCRLFLAEPHASLPSLQILSPARPLHSIYNTPPRSSTQKNALYLSISNGNIIYNNTCITSVPGMKKSLLLCFAAGCYTACRRFTFLLCDTTVVVMTLRKKQIPGENKPDT